MPSLKNAVATVGLTSSLFAVDSNTLRPKLQHQTIKEIIKIVMQVNASDADNHFSLLIRFYYKNNQLPFPRFKCSENLFVLLIKEKYSFHDPIFPSLMSVTAGFIQWDGSQTTCRINDLSIFSSSFWPTFLTNSSLVNPVSRNT